MLDPLVIRLLSLAFAMLLAAAAAHKAVDLARFRGTLSAYQVLPAALTAPAARLVIGFEAALAAAWALGWNPAATAAATAALLGVYTLAIGLNLARGRAHIDCGCAFGGAGASGQQLSGRLLARNVLLIAAALAAALPPAPRELLPIDHAGLVCACLALALLYAGGSQLLSNAQAINSWRKSPAGGDQA